MKLKKTKKNEVLPSVYMENRPVEVFDPDFAIVNVIKNNIDCSWCTSR